MCLSLLAPTQPYASVKTSMLIKNKIFNHYVCDDFPVDIGDRLQETRTTVAKKHTIVFYMIHSCTYYVKCLKFVIQLSLYQQIVQYRQFLRNISIKGEPKEKYSNNILQTIFTQNIVQSYTVRNVNPQGMSSTRSLPYTILYKLISIQSILKGASFEGVL